MLKISKKHRTAFAVLALVFVIAWAVWTFYLLPKSETPNLPEPVMPQAAPPTTN